MGASLTGSVRMPEHLGWQVVILGSVALVVIALLGAVAMLQGVDGALYTALVGAIIGVLVIIVLRKLPGT